VVKLRLTRYMLRFPTRIVTSGAGIKTGPERLEESSLAVADYCVGPWPKSFARSGIQWLLHAHFCDRLHPMFGTRISAL